MKKSFVFWLVILMALVSCAGTGINHKSIDINGQDVTLGMDAQQVREIMGAPDKTETATTPFGADSVSGQVFAGVTYWLYGDRKADPQSFQITFKNNIVTSIYEVRR
jgi:hypothetical protein